MQSPPSLFWRGNEKRVSSRVPLSSNRINSLPWAARPGIACSAELAALVDRATGVVSLHLGEVAVEIIADDAVHQRQPVERVAGIGNAAAGIGFDAISLDIAAGQRGAAEHDRDV